MCMSVYVYIYIYVHECVCVCVCIYVCAWVCVCVCMYVYIYIYIYIYIYVRVCVASLSAQLSDEVRTLSLWHWLCFRYFIDMCLTFTKESSLEHKTPHRETIRHHALKITAQNMLWFIVHLWAATLGCTIRKDFYCRISLNVTGKPTSYWNEEVWMLQVNQHHTEMLR